MNLGQITARKKEAKKEACIGRLLEDSSNYDLDPDELRLQPLAELQKLEGKRFPAQLIVKGTSLYLGMHDTEAQAAAARNAERSKITAMGEEEQAKYLHPDQITARKEEAKEERKREACIRRLLEDSSTCDLDRDELRLQPLAELQKLEGKTFRAQLIVKGTSLYLGMHDTEAQAAAARNAERSKITALGEEEQAEYLHPDQIPARKEERKREACIERILSDSSNYDLDQNELKDLKQLF